MAEIASKIEKKRVSILGCGWLGLALAQRLQRLPITSTIKGSTTTPDKTAHLRQWGIEPFVIPMNPGFTADSETLSSFFDSDVLVISLPPRAARQGADFYPGQMSAVVEQVAVSPVKEVIFISSTGVYPDQNRVMNEEDVTLPEHSPLPEMVTAENLIQSLRPQCKVTILRLGGLLGYLRNPGKYVAGKKDMDTGDIPVNYIHRDDAAGIIATIIKNGVVNETFNIVSPMHPTRKEVYLKSCAEFGWEAPTFDESAAKPDFKIISGEKLSKHYTYTFQYPDPLHFHYSLTNPNAQ
jgi:nucleoside-diphosphate-sugar epimerase